MFRRHCLGALVILAVLAVSASGQDLKWKFEKDKAFYQEMTTETTQAMKVMGMDVNQKQKQTFYFSWKPVEEKDKAWTIKQKIEGVKMDIEIGGNKITYDSTNPTASTTPLADFFKALVGSEFTLTVAPDADGLKVTKIEGREEFLKKLVQANQQMEPLLKQILSEDALKQMADPAFAVVPNKEVKKDEKWNRKSTLNLGPIGTYDSTYDYKYEGKEKEKSDLDKISVTTTLKYTPPSETAAGGLPFRIKSADLKSKDATGTVLFNPKTGRVESSESNLTLEGDLQIEIGGQTTKVELKQTQKTTTKTTEKNPIEKSGS